MRNDFLSFASKLTPQVRATPQYVFTHSRPCIYHKLLWLCWKINKENDYRREKWFLFGFQVWLLPRKKAYVHEMENKRNHLLIMCGYQHLIAIGMCYWGTWMKTWARRAWNGSEIKGTSSDYQFQIQSNNNGISNKVNQLCLSAVGTLQPNWRSNYFI